MFLHAADAAVWVVISQRVHRGNFRWIVVAVAVVAVVAVVAEDRFGSPLGVVDSIAVDALVVVVVVLVLCLSVLHCNVFCYYICVHL